MPKVKHKGQTLADAIAFEKELQLDDGTPIVVGFNRQKYEWMQRYIKILKFGRGIREQGLQVDSDAALLMRQRAKQDGRQQITMSDLSAVKAQIGGVMNTATDDAFAELLVAVVIDYSDTIFEFQEVKNGITVNVKPPFDLYEVPDWYFEKPEDDDPLMAMFIRNGHALANEPKRNPQNPVDVMCGLAAGILEQNPLFKQEIDKIVDRASLAAYFGGVDVENDGGVFLSLVDRVLFDSLANGNDNDDGGNPANGTDQSDENVGENPGE